MIKKKHKFEIGDIVIVTRQLPDEDEGLLLATGTIAEDNAYPYVMLEDDSRYPNPSMYVRERGWAINEDDMELLSIYNSPLWLALR